MNPLPPITALPQDPVPIPDPLELRSAASQQFNLLIDQMIGGNHAKSSISQAAILAEEKIDEFQKKLAILTGRLDQARVALDGASDSGSLSTERKQDYYFAKSQLSQAGIPGGVDNIA